METHIYSLLIVASLAQATVQSPLTLSQAYRSALATSEYIQMARESLTQAELLPMRAIARVAPQISVGGEFKRQREVTGFFGAVVPADQQTYYASVAWPLVQFEFIPRMAQGSAVIDSKRAGLDVVIQRTLHTVATSYYAVLKAQRLSTLTKAFERQAQEHWGVAKTKFEQGVVRKTVLIQAELDVERAKKRVIEMDNSLAVAEEELRSAVGMSLRGMPLEDPPPPPLPDGITASTRLPDLIAFAIAHRPDALQAKLDVVSAWADRDAAFTKVLPTIGLQGEYTINDPQTLFNQREQWRVGAQMKIPLFQGGEEWLAQTERASLARQSELARDALHKQIELDVTRAYYAWQVLVKNLEVLTKQVALSKENYRMVESQFTEQLASSAEVTDAHITLMNAEVDLTRESYDYQVAVLTLLKMLGVFPTNF